MFVLIFSNWKQILFVFLAAGTITCQIDSPDRDECIKEAIQDMLPKLVVRMIRDFNFSSLFQLQMSEKFMETISISEWIGRSSNSTDRPICSRLTNDDILTRWRLHSNWHSAQGAHLRWLQSKTFGCQVSDNAIFDCFVNLIEISINRLGVEFNFQDKNYQRSYQHCGESTYSRIVYGRILSQWRAVQ